MWDRHSSLLCALFNTLLKNTECSEFEYVFFSVFCLFLIFFAYEYRARTFFFSVFLAMFYVRPLPRLRATWWLWQHFLVNLRIHHVAGWVDTANLVLGTAVVVISCVVLLWIQGYWLFHTRSTNIVKGPTRLPEAGMYTSKYEVFFLKCSVDPSLRMDPTHLPFFV